MRSIVSLHSYEKDVGGRGAVDNHEGNVITLAE